MGRSCGCHVILGSCRSRKGKTQYLVKWRELPYEQSTWEDLAKENYLKGARDAIDSYNHLRCVRVGMCIHVCVLGEMCEWESVQIWSVSLVS